MAKLSTQEILAQARAQAGQPEKQQEPAASSEDVYEETTADEAASAEETGESATAAEPTPSAPQATPTSTADILAAARAQAAGKSGGESAPTKKAETPAAAKPATGGKAPGSTADILAAARAQAGGGGKPAAKEKPAAAKPAAKGKPAAPAKPAGDRPSVQEMLKAVREGKPVETTAAATEKPKAPPMPTRPAPSKKAAKPAGETRRNMLVALFATPFALAWTLFAAASGVFSLALARFMMPNVLIEPPTRFKIGPPADYPFGTVSTKWKAQFAIWVVHTLYKGRPMIYALSSVCTHLGCTPNWLEGEQKFKCPCHGSGFYINGVNFEGPAPRPLERVGIALAADGMLEVDKSMKFQEEMGQWEDATSFVAPPVA